MRILYISLFFIAGCNSLFAQHFFSGYTSVKEEKWKAAKVKEMIIYLFNGKDDSTLIRTINYDTLGHQTEIKGYAINNMRSDHIRFMYDQQHFLISSVADFSGKTAITSYSNNSKGKPLTIQTLYSDSTSFTLTNTYDSAGKITSISMRYSTGETNNIQQFFNAQGHIYKSVANSDKAGTTTTTLEYDMAGNNISSTKTDRMSKVIKTNAFDQQGRIIQQDIITFVGQVKKTSTIQYQYGAGDLIYQITWLDPGRSPEIQRAYYSH